jgi:hypothetical protein
MESLSARISLRSQTGKNFQWMRSPRRTTLAPDLDQQLIVARRKSQMSNRLIELSAAAALLVATPSLAAAQTVALRGSTVSLTACNVNESFEGLGFNGPYSFRTGVPQPTTDIALSYVNKANVPAKNITFAVKDGAYTQNIVAKGMFAPGVQIDKSFTADSEIGARPDAACTVAEVDFADGSVWHAAHADVVSR